MAIDNLSSHARGRSLYRAIIPFPVVCFALALMTDLAFWATASVLWETMSVWLLAVGLVVAGFAVIAGIIDLVRSRRVAGLGQPWLVVLGHAAAFGLSIVNVFVHSRDGYTAVVPDGLILSVLAVLVLLGTDLLGRLTTISVPAGRSV